MFLVFLAINASILAAIVLAKIASRATKEASSMAATANFVNMMFVVNVRVVVLSVRVNGRRRGDDGNLLGRMMMVS